ncbi:MAG: hypothetical protein JWQ27_1907 [Ferruginibacter sp.]|nr:hypothetical protein [Ferruginibacter sp.]
MKNLSTGLIAAVILATGILISCKKTNDDTVFSSYTQYVNPKLGKYIIYNLDSTVTASFGAYFVKKSYLVKDSIVAVITDGMGRESYKIFRYQYDSAQRRWNSTNTFLLTPTPTSLELVENNFRYIKLVNPIEDDKSWQGNRYVNQSPFYPNTFFPDWTYYYRDVAQPKKIGAFNFANTVTVVQYDSTDNRPFYPKGYNFYDRSYEIYADSIGLVYKDIMSWEYQAFTSLVGCKLVKPKTGGGFDTTNVNCNLASTNCDSLARVPNYRIISCDTVITQAYYNGYGVKQTIVSHN